MFSSLRFGNEIAAYLEILKSLHICRLGTEIAPYLEIR